MTCRPESVLTEAAGGDQRVIRVSRLDGKEFVLNGLLIETIEAVPDTVISMTTGRKHVVRESVEDVVARIIAYHGRIGKDVAGLAGEG